MVFAEGNSIERSLEARELALHLAQEQRDLIMFQVREARSFAQFGDPHHYRAYWGAHHSGRHEAILESFVELGIPKEEQELLADSELASEEMLQIEKVSMFLTIQAFGLDERQFPELAHFEYDIKEEVRTSLRAASCCVREPQKLMCGVHRSRQRTRSM